MPLVNKDAERGLELMWEFVDKTDDPRQKSAYKQAISCLHCFVTDVIPASQPHMRTKVNHASKFSFSVRTAICKPMISSIS